MLMPLWMTDGFVPITRQLLRGWFMTDLGAVLEMMPPESVM